MDLTQTLLSHSSDDHNNNKFNNNNNNNKNEELQNFTNCDLILQNI